MGVLDSILLNEKSISRELHGFLQMKAFPTSELAIVRKEVKAFKEHQEVVLQSRSDQMGGGMIDVKLISIIAAAAGSQSTADLTQNVINSSPSKNADAGVEGDLAALFGGYDDLIGLLTAENRLCERKLLMFGNRRQEEEDRRVVYMKKMARAKALQDAQERDPANFKNQRSF